VSRIRSIHPGIASDESYMQMSMAAKAAWPILWTECDDHGVFEWKPVVLKARIFPADNVDFAAILAELVSLDCVQRFEHEGKPYGIVRNFCAYQRPKHPSYRHPFPAPITDYAAFKPVDVGSPTPALPEPSPRPTEKPPQMKEEVGVGEEEKPKPTVSSKSPRGSRWQKGQAVPDEWKAWAKASFPSVEAYRLSTETRKFENHYPAAPGKDGVRSDWEGTYRNWMMRAFPDAFVDSTGPPADELVVLRPDEPAFQAVQRLRKSPIIVGNSGVATFSKAEVERATAA
jgi:hypothetical protein